MTHHPTITAGEGAPTLLDSIKRVSSSLPIDQQFALIEHVASDLSGFYGADDIVRGVEDIRVALMPAEGQGDRDHAADVRWAERIRA